MDVFVVAACHFLAAWETLAAATGPADTTREETMFLYVNLDYFFCKSCVDIDKFVKPI